MPRNKQENVENFKDWISKVLSNAANGPNEDLDYSFNNPWYLAAPAYTRFKCNIERLNHYVFVQNAILERLTYLNRKETLETLNDIVHNDRIHYSEYEIRRAEGVLKEIYDDTEKLLELSKRLARGEAHAPTFFKFKRKEKKKSKRKICICFVDYDDKEKRTFKMK